MRKEEDSPEAERKQRKNSKFFQRNRDLAIVLISGLMALVGAIGGTWISNHLENQSEHRKQILQEEREVYQKRIELIERAVRLLGKAPGTDDTWRQYLKNLKEGKTSTVEVVRELSEQRAEYQEVMLLSYLYFGDRTRQEIEEFGKIKGPWWSKDEEKLNNIIGEMALELGWGLKNYNFDKILGQPPIPLSNEESTLKSSKDSTDKDPAAR